MERHLTASVRVFAALMAHERERQDRPAPAGVAGVGVDARQVARHLGWAGAALERPGDGARTAGDGLSAAGSH